MNILIAGRGKGSWEMRGVQIGAALGARVRTEPTDDDFAWSDVVILLKKHAVDFALRAHRAGKPIVWDALDFWSQPSQNRLEIPAAIVAFQQLKARIKPAAVICATEKMAADCGGTYIPHHCRFGLAPTPPREQVKIVGYDGSERYLGAWDVAIRAECARRGWSFVINPPDLSTVDILVAFRDGMWDGPICRAWKSGVKYVNAEAIGRPIVTQRCAAFDELLPVGDHIEDAKELSTVLDIVSNDSIRKAAFSEGAYFSQAYVVDAVAANHYRPLLDRVISEAPCTVV
jgi:hypothetical protein